MNIAGVLLNLHECLATQITEKAEADPEFENVCSVSVQWSDGVLLDHCGAEVSCEGGVCGQAWVRFAGIMPDPEVDQRTVKCTAAFQVTFEVGIARCSATGDPGTQEFRTPTEDEYLADVLAGSADMDVITQTVLCCSKKLYGQSSLQIASLAPFGPEGGCFGTMANVTMKVTV